MSLTNVKMQLMDCEKAIEQGVTDTAFALRKVRNERLYREGWASFDDYCQDRWGWTRSRAYQIIDQADTIEAITAAECPQIVDILPTNEGQTRPLTRLEPEERASAWAEAVEVAEAQGKPAPTGKIVAEVVDKILPPVRRPQSDAHPAKFSQELMAVFATVLRDQYRTRILDPFAGTGLVHALADDLGIDSVGVEIEQEWADKHERTICGDSTRINADMVGDFDCVVTSPAYGNRMADKHNARDESDRMTYRHRLGRDLSENNGGGMQWGDNYRALHGEVWHAVSQSMRRGGIFVLNIKDHVRDGERVAVSAWHLRTLLGMGFEFQDDASIGSAGLGGAAGENRETRIGVEHVYVLRKL